MARRERHGPTPPPPPPPSPPTMGCSTTIVLLSILISIPPAWCLSKYGDAEHVTAILGESVVLNCPVSLPKTPYIIQWKKESDVKIKIPIYIWYEGYDPHVEDSYKGRASRVPAESSYGLASLQLTDVREADQGWYECKVFYLDRRSHTDNGTWVHLDVHAPPRFTTVPDPITYVNIGDSIILNCEAEGTPKPEIIWFRDDEAVLNSEHMGIINDGTELRINKIRDEDIGDYVCVARNAEGRKHHEAKVVIAGGAVIVTPPHNQTKQEGEKVEFPCEARALPGNVTVAWKREGVEIDKLAWLDTRTVKRKDGTLIVNPTSADDGGFFTCEVSNGIGTAQRATAYLNVEYPARVTYTPTVQYLPLQHQGIIKCFVKSNPDIQFVTWIKDKRLFDSDKEEGIIKLKNGSLLITQVTRKHQGRYSCTPYNRHTTAGSSGDMEILVREPPKIQPRPQQQYHGKMGDDVVLMCGGVGTPPPEVNWRRRDGQNLPRDRTVIEGGNLTIRNLRKADHAFYECVVSNEIATLVTATQLLVEGTTPHPPYNISSEVTAFSVKLSWQPGYPGGNNWDQEYTIWYRVLGTKTWSQIDIKQQGSTEVTVYKLLSDQTYEFQVQGKNELGDGMFSDTITATTLGSGGSATPRTPVHRNKDTTTTPETHAPVGTDDVSPEEVKDARPKPAPPRNVTVKGNKDGTVIISWLPPEDLQVPVAYYDIEYKNEGSWKKLNRKQILDSTSFSANKLNAGKKYTFRVFAKTLTSFQASGEVEFTAPMQDKDKAITAALVGGFLFFTVAIILSVCTVKICNKRKRKKQEKELQSHLFYDPAYNMVACRVTETRNGGHGSSPVPLKKLLRCGVPGMKWGWAWIAGVLLGRGLLDSTDSRPLHSGTSAPQDGPTSSQKPGTDEVDYRVYGVEKGRRFPRDVRYSVEMEYSQPLGGWIARKADGRFVLDNGSDDGGFTSPRRPTRRIHPLSHGAERGILTPVWVAAEDDVQSGVYHVRAGTTSRLDHRQPLPPRLSLRSDGSGASTNDEFRPLGYRTHGPRGTLLTYNMQNLSPEFGRHQIPSSPPNIGPSPNKRFRSSSPGPLSNEWNQLAQLASFTEDLSSVQQPSSVERSFPSTVLSSWPNSNQNTPSAHGVSGMLSPLSDDLGDLHQRYSNQLPPLHQYANLRSRRLHLVGAEVHSPPSHLQPSVSHMWSPSASLGHTWVTPRRHTRMRPTVREVNNSQHLIPGHLELSVLGSGQHVHSPSVRQTHIPGQGAIRETLGHIQPPRIPDIPLHYVNLPPRSGDPYQRIPGQDPPYLLKPSSSENQKPLATSSPPRPRAAHTRQPQPVQGPLTQLPHHTMPSTNTAVPDPMVRQLDKIRNKDLNSDQQPLAYTRDRLNETIEQLRSDIYRKDKGADKRTSSSAPELSYLGKSEVKHANRRLVRPAVSAPVSQEQSHEQSQEISHEQSPDTSSGFGSKNTSQQQSSSQSGQSLSALGLDNSRLDASQIESSEAPETFVPSGTAVSSHWVEIRPQVRRTPFIRPPQPPPYEVWEARQVLPQFRMPGLVGMRPSGVVMGAVSRWNKLAATPMDASIDSTGPTLVSPRTKLTKISTTTTPLSPSQPLDVSVDDHYEFDTVLSPIPGDDIAAEWSSRSRVPSGERGLSDSEIYGSSGRRRHESMEARVAAMKQEFNEYRIKQAHRRRRSREMESVC